jgi:lipid II:glycine glycyltransferase (peptidoglycan interpeptide bridge formation enzyme)
MGCGCKNKKKKTKEMLTREQVIKKEEQMVKLRESIREQLTTFKRLTKQ